MKLLIIACLCALTRASLFDHLENNVDPVGDSAHTLDDSIDAEAHGAVRGVSQTLHGTFDDVWKIVETLLKEAGQGILSAAGTLAQEQGLPSLLASLADGKREVHDEATMKTYLSALLVDEYQKWLKDIKQDIMGSKDELATAVNKANAVNDLPGQLKKYILEYVDAVTRGDVATFVTKQADVAFKNAVAQLKERLDNRVHEAINQLSSQ